MKKNINSIADLTKTWVFILHYSSFNYNISFYFSQLFDVSHSAPRLMSGQVNAVQNFLFFGFIMHFLKLMVRRIGP